MRSSNRIIRGDEAASLPNWSVDLIGSHYDTPAERLLSELSGCKESLPKAQHIQGAQETRLHTWEQNLKQREAEFAQLQQETLKQARETGQQRGYEAGWNAAHQERVQLIHATQSLHDQFESFKKDLSRKILELALLTSKKVIGDTIALHPEQVCAVLEEIVQSMQLESKSVTLRAHPDTAKVLEAQFGDKQMLSNLKIYEDKNQLPGGFILQHPEGEVDATIQTRWLRTIETFGHKDPLAPGDLPGSEAM